MGEISNAYKFVVGNMKEKRCNDDIKPGKSNMV
jgi:hypothetical protein